MDDSHEQEPGPERLEDKQRRDAKAHGPLGRRPPESAPVGRPPVSRPLGRLPEPDLRKGDL
jgi:hypothetical protein